MEHGIDDTSKNAFVLITSHDIEFAAAGSGAVLVTPLQFRLGGWAFTANRRHRHLCVMKTNEFE